MKSVDNLTESAAELAARGLSKGEIADELNVSRETAAWLVERADSEAEPAAPEPSGPQDIHVDWSAIGRDSFRLSTVGAAMADLLTIETEDVGITVGIEKAGVPIATTIAQELDTDLSTYAPRKHQWEEGDIENYSGGFSRNFSAIRDRECYVVDDTITSGTTMGEAIEAIREEGGEPAACVVIADKQGLDELDGVPVYSLLQVISVGSEDEAGE